MDTREGPVIGANTKRALEADLRLFTGWCAERAAQALPARAETVAAFVDDMARSPGAGHGAPLRVQHRPCPPRQRP